LAEWALLAAEVMTMTTMMLGVEIGGKSQRRWLCHSKFHSDSCESSDWENGMFFYEKVVQKLMHQRNLK
jgi:hypothetical protein